jgi:hypothetical protein
MSVYKFVQQGEGFITSVDFEEITAVIMKKSTPYAKYLRAFATMWNESLGRRKFGRAREKYEKRFSSFRMRHLMTVSFVPVPRLARQPTSE